MGFTGVARTLQALRVGITTFMQKNQFFERKIHIKTIPDNFVKPS